MGGDASPLPLPLARHPPTRLFCEELQTCIPATMQPPWSAQPRWHLPLPTESWAHRGGDLTSASLTSAWRLGHKGFFAND